MTNSKAIQKLATEKNFPCVTISLNTHKTHPDNAQDIVQLKKLLRETEERLINEFGKRSVASLLTKLTEIQDEVDVNYNLDSLHIFLSNDTKEIVKSNLPIKENAVHISDSFNIRSLIKSHNRNQAYYILLLSQSGVNLFKATSDHIESEIENDDFPFPENRHYNTHSDKGSDPKHLDDLVREFLNKVDKAVVKMHNETDLNCVVVCTEDNYSRLMQAADQPSVYLGYANIDYNHTANHQIAKQAWELMLQVQHQQRTDAIKNVKEAVAQGNVLTDLQEIYQAALDGRGELLIIHEDFTQAVLMTSDRTFDLTDDSSQNNVVQDIASKIAWEVLSKKGHVFFTAQDEIKELGDIVLKTRY